MTADERCLIFSIALLLFLPMPAIAATIVKSNGDQLEGQVRGLIVLRDLPEDSEEDSGTYSVTYFTVNGSDIVRIDKDGLRYAEGSDVGVLVTVLEGSEPEALEALETAVKNPPPSGMGGLWLQRTPSGALMTLGKKGQDNLIKGTFLGEFRMGDESGEIVPFLELSSGDGNYKIPIEDLPESY